MRRCRRLHPWDKRPDKRHPHPHRGERRRHRPNHSNPSQRRVLPNRRPQKDDRRLLPYSRRRGCLRQGPSSRARRPRSRRRRLQPGGLGTARRPRNRKPREATQRRPTRFAWTSSLLPRRRTRLVGSPQWVRLSSGLTNRLCPPCPTRSIRSMLFLLSGFFALRKWEGAGTVTERASEPSFVAPLTLPLATAGHRARVRDGGAVRGAHDRHDG
jgi:hypothetical protein